MSYRNQETACGFTYIKISMSLHVLPQKIVRPGYLRVKNKNNRRKNVRKTIFLYAQKWRSAELIPGN